MRPTPKGAATAAFGSCEVGVAGPPESEAAHGEGTSWTDEIVRCGLGNNTAAVQRVESEVLSIF